MYKLDSRTDNVAFDIVKLKELHLEEFQEIQRKTFGFKIRQQYQAKWESCSFTLSDSYQNDS